MRMYKVYINNTPINLISTQTFRENSFPNDARNLVAPYAGKSKFLFQYIDKLEKNDQFESITLYDDDEQKLRKDFEKLFRIVPAAGGLVFNEKGEALLIFRRGYWDLPKGKIEEDETIETAALREVEEETGLQNIKLGGFLCETYHTYRDRKKRRCIKQTYWYKMETVQQKLTPQTEEDIEKAVWAKLDTFLKEDITIYPNILYVIQQNDNS